MYRKSKTCLSAKPCARVPSIMANCYSFVRDNNVGAPQAALTPLDEQDTISVPAKHWKGEGRIKFHLQNLVSRTKHAIDDITRFLHRKVGAILSVESEGLSGTQRSDNVTFSTVNVDVTYHSVESEGLHGGENSDEDSFSTEDSTGGSLKDSDGADIQDCEGKIRDSEVFPEGNHRHVAYVDGELSKCKQRIKGLTEKMVQMEKKLVVKGQKEKELTQQMTGLVAELLESKEIIKENSEVEIFLGQKILFGKMESALTKQKNGFLTTKVLELEQLLEDVRSVNECKICYSRPSNVVIYPCLHAQYCSICVLKVMKKGRACPSCRCYIKRVLSTS